MPKKVLSEEQIDQIKTDLAASNLSQRDIAAKFGVSETRISQIKVENQQDIEKRSEKALEIVTGELVRSQEWRMLQYERDLAKLEGYRSPDAIRVRATILKQLAEEMGQLPPRMQIAIQVAEHQYVGIDVEQV